MTDSSGGERKMEKNREKSESFFPASKSGSAAEKVGTRIPSRFSFRVTLFLFLVWFLIVFLAVLGGGTLFFPAYFPKTAFCAGAAAFLAGIIQIIVSWYIRLKYGVLVDFLVGMFARTGIPLIAALVFFLLFDNILFKYSVLTLAVFYLLLMPFEVWLSFPRLDSSEAKPESKHAEEDKR